MTWLEDEDIGEVYKALVVDYLIDRANKGQHIDIDDDIDELDEAFEMLDFADGLLIDVDTDENKVSLTEVYDNIKSDSEKLLSWARENADVFSYDEMQDNFPEGLTMEVSDRINENVELSSYYLDGAIKNKETGAIHFYFNEVDPLCCHEDYLSQSLEFCKGFVDFCTPEKIIEEKDKLKDCNIKDIQTAYNENKQMQSFDKSDLKPSQNKNINKGETK